MTPQRARSPGPLLLCTALFAAVSLTWAVPAAAQWDAPVQPHRIPLDWGEVLLDATLHFRYADAYQGGPAFAELLTTDDLTTALDPSSNLDAAMEALGAGDAPLVAGGLIGAAQTSQTRLPLTVRAGLPWGLELEATARFVRTRLEADRRLLQAPDATLGRSPALDDATLVQEFVDEVVAATDGFSAEGRDWDAWGAAWRAAYRASVLFPISDSEAATQLIQDLETLNAALTAAGRAPVSRAPLFAAGALSGEQLDGLLAGAPYGLTPFAPVPFLWRNGDIDVVLHRGLLGDARHGASGDSTAGHGLRASGGVRLPVASQADPDLPFSTAAGNGVFAVLLGANGWLTSGPWTLSGSLRSVLNGSKDVVRRIGPVGTIFLGRESRTALTWTPGRRIFGHARLEFQPAGPLRLSVGYTFDQRGEDTYERLGSIPEADPTVAFPSPPAFSDPALLEAGTGGTIQWLRGGVRWVPRERGAFGIDLDVGVPVTGEIPRAYEFTELRFRVYRAIRLGALFD